MFQHDLFEIWNPILDRNPIRIEKLPQIDSTIENTKIVEIVNQIAEIYVIEQPITANIYNLMPETQCDDESIVQPFLPIILSMPIIESQILLTNTNTIIDPTLQLTNISHNKIDTCYTYDSISQSHNNNHWFNQSLSDSLYYLQNENENENNENENENENTFELNLEQSNIILNQINIIETINNITNNNYNNNIIIENKNTNNLYFKCLIKSQNILLNNKINK